MCVLGQGQLPAVKNNKPPSFYVCIEVAVEESTFKRCKMYFLHNQTNFAIIRISLLNFVYTFLAFDFF